MSVGKKYAAAAAKVEEGKLYSPAEAAALVKENATAKFDETIEAHFRLGIDTRQADQQLRGSISLPNGSGQTVRVAVFAEGDKAKEAEAAGADIVGSDELVAKIQGGFFDFDATVATPDMMGLVGRLGKVLGPRGLMPNPKVGTVTLDVTRAINEIKAGKIEYRTDKAGNIHAPIGKGSFESAKLQENFQTLIDTLNKAKPSAAKGQYMRAITVSTTMGPGIKINPTRAVAGKKE